MKNRAFFIAAAIFFMPFFVPVGIAQVGMVRVVGQVGQIVVSEKEIARGYVLVEDAALIEVDSNYMKPYALSYKLTGHTFRTVWAVDQDRREIQIGKIGIFNYPDRRESGAVLKKISFKLYISDNVKPGEYPWPLRLNIIF